MRYGKRRRRHERSAKSAPGSFATSCPSEVFRLLERLAHRPSGARRRDLTEDGLTEFGEAYGPPRSTGRSIDEVTPLASSERSRTRARPCSGRTCTPRSATTAKGLAGRRPSRRSTSRSGTSKVRRSAAGLPAPRRPLPDAGPRYATGLYRHASADNATALAREAEAYAAEGFQRDEDEGRLRPRRRRAERAGGARGIGGDRLLAMDANHAYDAGQAIRLGRSSKGATSPGSRSPSSRRTWTATVSQGGAHGSRSRRRDRVRTLGLRDLCARRAVDIVAADICGCGGSPRAWRIAALASASSLTVYPHVGGPPSASSRASISPRRCRRTHLPWLRPTLVRLDRTPNPLRDQLALNRPSARRATSWTSRRDPGWPRDRPRRVEAATARDARARSRHARRRSSPTASRWSRRARAAGGAGTLAVDPSHRVAVFLAAVMVAALVGGLRSGLLATVLASLLMDYFFFEPSARSSRSAIARTCYGSASSCRRVLISLLNAGAPAGRGRPRRVAALSSPAWAIS